MAIGILKDRHGAGVYVTAPSGSAASRIAGTTLHSFAGFGLGSGPASCLVDKVLNNRWAVRRWQDCKILVIDEISMLSGKLFDVLDSIGRACCNSKFPFGGIQLIVCGDFFQLPPIRDEGLAFQAKAWARVSDFFQAILYAGYCGCGNTYVDCIVGLRQGLQFDKVLPLCG